MDNESAIGIETLKRELKDELTGNILPFWLDRTFDHVRGGFLGHLDFHGKPVPGANKGAILNARILWTFSASFREFGDPAYLQAAHRAYGYFMEYFVDRKYGGVYWEVDAAGSPVQTKKQVYALAFAIYGLSEYYRATGTKAALDQAIALYGDIEKYGFDQARNGYYEAFSRNWGKAEDPRLSDKDQYENKTANTHLHILEAYTNLCRTWDDDGLKLRLLNLVELFTERFINADGHLNLFFDDDWNPRSDLVSFGHDIECSWLLQEAAEVAGDRRLLEKCRKLAVYMAEQNLAGLDSDGGLFYEYFPTEDRWDRDKHWWPQAEAIAGYYNAYQVSDRIVFLESALGSWRFIQNTLVDTSAGEWHWSVDDQGIPHRGEPKAGFWKCPYHNSRACLEIIRR